jgi:peptide/nickel transport system permease protein
VIRYLLRRVLAGLTVIVAASAVSFLLFYVSPQDPAQAMCGTHNCSPQRLADIRASLHLDEPKSEQFADFFVGLVVGRDVVTGGITRRCPAPCLGYSFISDQPVTPMILRRIPVTASICFGAAIVFLTVGVAAGSAAARRRGSPLDRLLVTGSLAVGSVPIYIVLLVAALYLTILHPILPRGGYHPLFTDGPLAWASGLLAAWLVLGLVNSTAYARFSRASMVDTLSQDFIRTARAKGLAERTVVYRHGLRASAGPVLTIFGLDLANLLTGAIFTERIFDLPGLGSLSLDALASSDLPVIMGTVLVGAVILVVFNLVVDVLYGVLDPRVRLW